MAAAVLSFVRIGMAGHTGNSSSGSKTVISILTAIVAVMAGAFSAYSLGAVDAHRDKGDHPSLVENTRVLRDEHAALPGHPRTVAELENIDRTLREMKTDIDRTLREMKTDIRSILSNMPRVRPSRTDD